MSHPSNSNLEPQLSSLNNYGQLITNNGLPPNIDSDAQSDLNTITNYQAGLQNQQLNYREIVPPLSLSDNMLAVYNNTKKQNLSNQQQLRMQLSNQPQPFMAPVRANNNAPTNQVFQNYQAQHFSNPNNLPYGYTNNIQFSLPPNSSQSTAFIRPPPNITQNLQQYHNRPSNSNIPMNQAQNSAMGYYQTLSRPNYNQGFNTPPVSGVPNMQYSQPAMNSTQLTNSNNVSFKTQNNQSGTSHTYLMGPPRPNFPADGSVNNVNASQCYPSNGFNLPDFSKLTPEQLQQFAFQPVNQAPLTMKTTAPPNTQAQYPASAAPYPGTSQPILVDLTASPALQSKLAVNAPDVNSQIAASTHVYPPTSDENISNAFPAPVINPEMGPLPSDVTTHPLHHENPGKRKIPDTAGLVHVYPNKKPQEVKKAEIGIEIFKPTSLRHVDALFGLATLYTTELESLGLAPCRFEKNQRIVDPVWMLRRNRMVVSTVYCLEAALLFLTHLQKYPAAYATTGIYPRHAEALLIKSYLRLGYILSKYTNNQRRAESMFANAKLLSKKDFSTIVTGFIISVPTARFLAAKKLPRQAIALIKYTVDEAIKMKSFEWLCGLTSELASLHFQNDEYILAVEAIETGLKFTDQFDQIEIKIALTIKLMLFHLKKRHYRSIALLLSKEANLFPLGSLSPVLSQLHVYFLIIHMLYLTEIGDLTTAKKMLKQVYDQVNVWDDPKLTPDICLPLKARIPAQSSEANFSDKEISTDLREVIIKFHWITRRQAVSLVYLISGLIYKPLVQKGKASLLLLEGTKRALGDLNMRLGDTFILGSALCRQKFYVDLLAVTMIHLAEAYLLQWDMDNCKTYLNQAVTFTAANNLWSKYNGYLLHIHGLLLHTAGQYLRSFTMYRAAYHNTEDTDCATAICLNLLSFVSDRKAHAKIFEITNQIQARCTEPHQALLSTTLDFFKGIFGEEIIVKKNYLSESLVKIKSSEYLHLQILVYISLGHLYLNTDTDIADKITCIAYKLASQAQNPLGGLYATSILKCISTIVDQPASFETADQECGGFKETIRSLRSKFIASSYLASPLQPGV